MIDDTQHRPLPQGLSVRKGMWPVAPVTQLENWDNEGGSLQAYGAGATTQASYHPHRLTLRNRRSEDTSAGCRERAEADLVRASAGAEGPGRWRYESSAASWMQRAEMLVRLEARRDEYAKLGSRPSR